MEFSHSFQSVYDQSILKHDIMEFVWLSGLGNMIFHRYLWVFVLKPLMQAFIFIIR